jgi:uncharacterized membrane protein YqiK
MSEQSVVPVEVQKTVEETSVMAKGYDNYVITTQPDYSGAGDDLKCIKAKTKEIDDLRKSITRPMDDAKAKVMEFFKKPLDFLAKAENSVKSAMLTYQQEQERIRKEEERRIAEAQRLEAEKLRKQAEAEAKKAETLKTAKAQENAAARAAELQAQAQAVESTTTVVPSTVEAVAGISTKTIWTFEIIDVKKIPREYLIPDEKYIGQMATATKGKKEIPGIRIFSKEIIAARR